MQGAGFRAKQTISSWLRRHGKQSFLKTLPPRSMILDVGCGGNQACVVKRFLPDCHYTGIDIQDYRQSDTSKSLIDRYILVELENFAAAITGIGHKFDAVISAHNLEHCDDREATLRAMLEVVKPSGKLYLSFPTEKSIDFPKRGGGMNYYADKTHKDKPHDFSWVIGRLTAMDYSVEFAAKRYRPIFLFIVGFLLEPYSKLKNRSQIGSWEYYGFETVIHAKKNDV